MPSSSLTAPARRILSFAVIVFVSLVSGCAAAPGSAVSEAPPLPQGGPPVPADHTAVIAPGTQVVAVTPNGRIRIEAGPGTRRIYSWYGLRRGAILKPRAQPFAGEDGKGLYFDGTPKVWAPAEGITRLRAEEGERNFATVSDAKIWMQIRRLYFIYNDHGLAVGWRRHGNTLQVEVWQFMIDGHRPTHMPGANDTAIQVRPIHAVPQKM